MFHKQDVIAIGVWFFLIFISFLFIIAQHNELRNQINILNDLKIDNKLIIDNQDKIIKELMNK